MLLDIPKIKEEKKDFYEVRLTVGDLCVNVSSDFILSETPQICVPVAGMRFSLPFPVVCCFFFLISKPMESLMLE